MPEQAVFLVQPEGRGAQNLLLGKRHGGLAPQKRMEFVGAEIGVGQNADRLAGLARIGQCLIDQRIDEGQVRLMPHLFARQRGARLGGEAGIFGIDFGQGHFVKKARLFPALAGAALGQNPAAAKGIGRDRVVKKTEREERLAQLGEAVARLAERPP
ncbi:hypothetical protein [Rhizobium rhizosphaerae]|nr:hypothetical protein [Xaviernesmea rhizosphaerae]